MYGMKPNGICDFHVLYVISGILYFFPQAFIKPTKTEKSIKYCVDLF